MYKVKKIILYFLCYGFFFFSLSGQAQMEDDFDNDLQKWEGTKEYFELSEGFLRSRGPESASALYLATPGSFAPNTYWEVGLDMAFNPSSTNFVRYYLAADNSNVGSAQKAYYIQLGETGGKNKIALYRQLGKNSIRIWEGRSVFSKSSGLQVRIKVELNEKKEWKVYSSPHRETPFKSEGAAYKDDSLLVFEQAYLGLYCKYSTVSRSSLYAFDYVSSDVLPTDTVLPICCLY